MRRHSMIEEVCATSVRLSAFLFAARWAFLFLCSGIAVVPNVWAGDENPKPASPTELLPGSHPFAPPTHFPDNTIQQKFPVGSSVPNFKLIDQYDRSQELYYYSDKSAVVLIVEGVHCENFETQLENIQRAAIRYEQEQVVFLVIDPELNDSREQVAALSDSIGAATPVLFDDAQLVSRTLGLSHCGEALIVRPSNWRLQFRGQWPQADATQSDSGSADAFAIREALLKTIIASDAPISVTPLRGSALEISPSEQHLTYTQDVSQILEQRCIFCHRPGGVAPWSMSDYNTVRGWSAMIREVIMTKRMPPWRADPHYGHFKSDLSLSVAEQQKLVDWIDSGAKRGEGADRLAEFLKVSAAPPEWPLGTPDEILELPEMKVPRSGENEYYNFLFDSPNDTDRWLRAVDFHPATPRLLHHGFAFLRHSESYTTNQNGIFPGLSLLAAYVPGDPPRAFPDDTGQLLKAHETLFFQLHYVSTGRDESDHPRLGLYYSKEAPSRRFRIEFIDVEDFVVPPRAKNVPVSGSTTFTEDVLLYGLSPHMHLRGKNVKVSVQLPTGETKTLLNVPDFSFYWQRRYRFNEPMLLPKGSVLTCSGNFDNSSQNLANPNPDQEVHYGTRTIDEMFDCFYNYYPRLPEYP